ncbi:MAG: zf-HC2 domain-containing protein [Armatimonadota bacterium]|nr:zf-HC2 domain-containing protein [Armatimonadota bacterium]
MTCDKAQDLFSELHEGTLAEGLILKVNRHLDDCPSCAHEFSSFKRSYSAFAAFGPTAVPDDLGEIIARRLDFIDYDKRQSPTRSGGWIRVAAIGAAAVALLAVVYVLNPASNMGSRAGIAPLPTQKSENIRIEKVDGKVRIRFVAEAATRVDLFEGGSDFAALPPIDAKQIRVDQVAAGSRYDVPINVDGPIPMPLWLRVSTAPGTIGVFFPQPAVLTSRTFEGNTVQSLQAIANGFGVVVEARLTGIGKKTQQNLEGEDPLVAAKNALRDTPYKEITLAKGVLHVR